MPRSCGQQLNQIVCMSLCAEFLLETEIKGTSRPSHWVGCRAVTSELTSSNDFPFSSASWIILAALVSGGIFCGKQGV